MPTRTLISLGAVAALVVTAVLLAPLVGSRDGVSHPAPQVSSAARQPPPAAAPADATHRADPDRPQLGPGVPAHADVLVATTRGHGSSQPLRFDIGDRNYTVAITCDAIASIPGQPRARGSIVDDRDPGATTPVSCDGVPNSWTVGGASGSQRIRFRTTAEVAWAIKVYGGTPDNVRIRRP